MPAGDPIRHVILLIMENRSFDHMLGGLSTQIPDLDGVDPASPPANYDSGGTAYPQEPTSARQIRLDLGNTVGFIRVPYTSLVPEQPFWDQSAHSLHHRALEAFALQLAKQVGDAAPVPALPAARMDAISRRIRSVLPALRLDLPRAARTGSGFL